MEWQHIVLVDDDPALGSLIRDLLVDEFGTTVTAEHTTAGAIASIEATRPDLVLLDMLLLDGTGADVLRALRANPLTGGVPVVVCTSAVLRAEDRDRLLELGAAAILPKPFRVDELMELVWQHGRGPNRAVLLSTVAA